jgi:hypothetical protein
MSSYRVQIDFGFAMFGLNRLMIGQARRLCATLDEQLGMTVAQRRTKLTIEASTRPQAEILRRQIEGILRDRLTDAQLLIQSGSVDEGWKTIA